MPALSPNGKPFSQTNQVNDLRPTDFVPMVRPSEPDPANQNVIIRGDRLTALLGTPGSVAPGPSLPLYSGPGTHTDGPMTQTAATDYANRGPNLRPDLAKSVRFYTRANNSLFDPNGDSALDELDPLQLCAGTTVRVDFGAGGTGPDHLELVYDAALPQAVPFRVWRDGHFGQNGGGGMIPAKWVTRDSAQAFAPAYASLPAGYQFTVGFFIRAYVTVSGSPSEQFFKAKTAGSLPAPTDPAGDANWEASSASAVPVIDVTKAYVDAANASQDNNFATLKATVATKADLVNGIVPANQLPAPIVAKLYTATGTATDGAMDQNSATAAFASKASILTTIDYRNEIIAAVSDDLGGAGWGKSIRLNGGTVTVYGSAQASAGLFGRVNLFSNGSTQATTLVCADTTQTFDGAATLTVGIGEYVLLRLSQGGYSIRMRGLLTAPGTGGAVPSGLLPSATPNTYTGRVAPQSYVAYNTPGVGGYDSNVQPGRLLSPAGASNSGSTAFFPILDDLITGVRGGFGLLLTSSAASIRTPGEYCQRYGVWHADLGSLDPRGGALTLTIKKVSDNSVIASRVFNQATSGPDVPAGGVSFREPNTTVFAPSYGEYYLLIEKSGPATIALYRVDAL